MSAADNKTYIINSPLENKKYNFEAIKNQIYDSLYSENYDFIQKIEQISKTPIKNILIILNGDSGNVFHSLTISQYEYEYQLLIVFDKITKILNDKKILKVLLNTKDQFGNTPFYYFVYYDCDKIIEYFLNISEKIFDNCIPVLNESGKSPIDAYLDKDYDFLQKLKNNRENYVFNIENGVSNLDLKELINETFDTDEKILISLLYFYFLDLKEKNKDERKEIRNEIEETLKYISLIYKKEFNIEYDKIIEIKEYKQQKFKELKADLINNVAYCYSNLINKYNEKLSEYKSENQYFVCLNNNKGDIITKPNNKIFALFNKYYKFLSKSKKAENIELFNNAIIDDFKNTFNVINSTNEDVNSIFTKILKIPVDKNNNYVETKDMIKINVNKNIFNYNKILNNCDLVDIMFKFYSNIPVKFNTVLLKQNTIQINKLNSDFINIYADKLKEKLIDIIKKSLREKCNINLTNKNDDPIFDFKEIIKFNFLNTIARGIKKYYYQNLNETYDKYEDLTKIISDLMIKKTINSEKLLQDYKTEILLNSCINDDIKFLEDKNNFEIKKYYLAYYIYYYFYIQNRFYKYVLEKYERFYNTVQTSNEDPDKTIEIKLDDIKNIFPAIFYIYQTILKGSQLTIEKKEKNNEKIYLSRGYITKNNKEEVSNDNNIENESYKVEDYRKLLFNIFSFLFLSCDYFVFYNYGDPSFAYLGRSQILDNNQDLLLYNLRDLDPEYVQDFFMCQLVYLKLILIGFKIQLINQRDYSKYIYNSGVTKLNILNNAINQNEIFIYQRLKYIQQSFKTLDILINVNPDFQQKYDREIYDLLMDKLQELDNDKFDELKIKYEIYVDQKKLMRFKGTEANKKEITKTLFNYIVSLESKVNDLIKFKEIEKYNDLSSLIFDDNDFDIENQRLFNMLDEGKQEYEKYFDIKGQNYDYQELTNRLNCNISTPFYIRDYNSFLIIPPTYLNTYSFSTNQDMTLKYFKIYNSFNRITSFLYSYNSSIYNQGISSPYYYYFVKPAADYMFNMKLFSLSLISNKDKIKKINDIDSLAQKDKFDETLEILTSYYNEDIFDFELTNLMTDFKSQKNVFIFSILNDTQKQIGKFDKLWFQNPFGNAISKDLILKRANFIDEFGDKDEDVIKKNIQEIKPVLNNYNYRVANLLCKKYNFISHINIFLNRYKISISTQHSAELKGYYISISKDKDNEKDYSKLIKGIIYSDDYFINNIEEPEIKNFDIKDYKGKIQKLYDFYNENEDKRNFELLKINLNNLLDPEMFLNNIINFNNLLLDFINKTKNLLILSIYKNITDDELKNRSVVLSITNVLNDNIYQQINQKLSGYKLVKKD